MPQIKGKDLVFLIFPSLFNQIMLYVPSGESGNAAFFTAVPIRRYGNQRKTECMPAGNGKKGLCEELPDLLF
jgi:hypothetical protein